MPDSVGLKHLKFLNHTFRNTLSQNGSQGIELKCCNGSLLYNKLLVGLLFPHLGQSQEYQLSVSDVILLPEFTVRDVFQKFDAYFSETVVTSNDSKENIHDELLDPDSVEEIVTEFIVEENIHELKANNSTYILPNHVQIDSMEGSFHIRDEKQNNETMHEAQNDLHCDESGEDFNSSKTLQTRVELEQSFSKEAEESSDCQNKAFEKELLPKQTYSCGVCGKEFRFQAHLQNHENTHVKPFKCGFCHEIFAEDNKLASHELNVHGQLINGGGVKSSLMKCSFCPKVFPARSQLILHERTHTKEKPFQCSQCDKTFSAKCNLTAHERIHFGDSKRYACRHPPCPRKFSHTSERKDHETIHTGDRPYMCPLCGERYKRNANLWRHKQKCGGRRKTGGQEPGLEEVDSQMIVEEDTDFIVHDPTDNSTTKYEIVFVDTQAGPGRRGKTSQGKLGNIAVSENIVTA